MAGGGRADTGRHRKRQLLLSKLYTFTSCARRPSAVDDEGSRIGGPGFSRVVCANDAAATAAGDGYFYRSNKISTTKYSAVTFLSNSLFEQFRRVASIYFLITALLSYSPVAPFRGSTAVAPLVLVLVATMVKEAIEDWRRKQQDVEVNNRKVKVFQDGAFTETKWTRLRVGDVVKVEKDDFFPADLILLSSSYDDAICYVETMNLDGETNLKLKQALDVTSHLQDDDCFGGFGAVIRCEDPNANLYSFVGNIEIEEQQHPLSPQQLLLRDSKLRNTEYVYGMVIFTGHDTKVMQNAISVPSKRSKIEKKMDGAIYLLLCSLVLISVIDSVFFGIATKDDLVDCRMKRWYLWPDDTTVVFDPNKAATLAVLHLFTAMILYGYFILISLYSSIELVKLLQAMFINSDIHMYHEESDTPTRARTSNLNEELGQGQVHTLGRSYRANVPRSYSWPAAHGRAGHGVGFLPSYAEPTAEARARTTAGHGLNMPLRAEGPTTDGRTGGDVRTAVPYVAQSDDGLHAYGYASTTMPRSGAGPSNNERAEGSTTYAWPAAHGHAGHGVGFPPSYAEPSAEARPRTISRLGHGLNMPLREEATTTRGAHVWTRVAVVPYVAQSDDGLHAYDHGGMAMPEGASVPRSGAGPSDMGRAGARTSRGSTLAQLMAGNSVIYDSDSDEGDHMLAEHFKEDVLRLTPMVLGHCGGLMPVHVQEAPPAVMEEPPAQNLWDRARRYAERYAAAAAAAAMWACGGTSGPRDMLRRGDK